MIFVSLASGHDTNDCGVHSKPCYSISYAIQQAAEESTIYLDGTGTELSPYTCKSYNANHPGVFLEKSASFIGIKSRAHISCNYGNSWLVNSGRNKNSLQVVFKNLFFQNTSLQVRDASVHIENTVFHGTKETAIKISLVKQTRFHLSLHNVVFKHNKACLLLMSKTKQQNEIFITINNSEVKSNGLRSLDVPTRQKWIFSFNGANDTMKIVINKTNFTGNFLQTKSTNEKSSGLIYIKNKFGKCNVSVEHSNFKDNGLHESTSETNFFFIVSSTLSAAIRSSQIVNSTSARLLYFTGNYSHVSVHHTEFRNFAIMKKHFQHGGIFSINARQISHLLIQDSCISQGKITTDVNGGVAYVDGLHVRITIRRSVVDSVRTNGNGGVFYIEKLGKAQQLLKSQLIFHTSNSNFHFNKAGNHGGVFFISTRDITTITSHNVTFENNIAVNGGGAVYVKPLSNKPTIVLNRSVFLRNTASGSHGGAIFIDTGPKNYVNLSIFNCTFENNSATYGGAVSVDKYGKIILFCRDSIFKDNHVSVLKNSIIAITQMSYKKYPHHTAYGGAMFLAVFLSKIRFVNTTFEKNKCHAKQGGALYIEMRNASTFHASNTSFTNNAALNDLGGAIFLLMSDDQIMNNGCLSVFDTNIEGKRSWTYLNEATFQNVTFINNTAFSGSALSAINGKTVLTSCEFRNNFASAHAGHISNDGSNRLTIENSLFSQTTASVSVNERKFYFTSFIQTYSGGPLIVRNSNFDQQIISDDQPLMMITLGGDFEPDHFTSFLCPVGSNITKTDISFTKVETAHCNRIFRSVRLSCKQCESKHYSLERGKITGLNEVKKFTCNPCPPGAYCLPTIKSRPNFWGYYESKHPPTLAFTFCPVGYCKSPTSDDTKYNACQGNRTGVMCGSCADGYSEELLSTRCRLASQCHHHWFWVPFFLSAFLIASFLVFKPSLPRFVKKHTKWINFNTLIKTRMEHANPEQSSSDSNEVTEESPIGCSTPEITEGKSATSGFLAIIFYFYQIACLLLNLYWFEELQNRKVIQAVIKFFNFEPSVSVDLGCPFPGLTPLTKKFFMISPVFAILLAIWIIFQLNWIIRFARRSRRDVSILPSYLAATMETLLLAYSAVANMSLSLVRCVPLGSETRWLHNGNIQCFQWWQYMAHFFNLFYVVPFIFTLAWASIKIQQRKVTARELFLATLLPLPLLFFWIFKAAKSFRRNDNDPEYPAPIRTMPSLDAMKLVLSEPFRKGRSGKEIGAVYWQSIMIARRFVLALLYNLIADPTVRLFYMTFFNVLVLSHHVYIQPFQKKMENYLESTSLLVLISFGLMNMHKSTYIGSDANVKPYLADSFEAYDWWEIVTLGLLPAVLVCVVSLGFLSFVVGILLNICRSVLRACTAVCTGYDMIPSTPESAE